MGGGGGGEGEGELNLFTDDCLSDQLNGKFWFGDPLSGEKFGKELKNVQDPRQFYNQVACDPLFCDHLHDQYDQNHSSCTASTSQSPPSCQFHQPTCFK